MVDTENSATKEAEPENSQAAGSNFQKRKSELNPTSEDTSTSTKESTFPKTETTMLVPDLRNRTRIASDKFKKQSSSKFKTVGNGSDKGKSMPITLPKILLPDSNLLNNKILYLKHLRRRITSETEDNRWEVHTDENKQENPCHEDNTQGVVSSQTSDSSSHETRAGRNGKLVLSSRDGQIPREENETEVAESPEPLFVPKEVWIECARDHLAKLIEEREAHPLTGMCTILCLDVSASMKGQPMQNLKEFVSKYLDHAEHTSAEHDLHENIGMVIFGHETRVLHGATADYKALRTSLDKLYASGPSPLYAGLIMAEAAIHEGTFSIFDFPFNPRIVLVTDGYITPAEMISGPDDSGYIDRNSVSDVIDRARVLGRLESKIFAVPVGKPNTVCIQRAYKRTTKDFLRKVTSQTYGEVLLSKQHTQLYRSYRNFVTGVKIRLLYRTVYRWELDREAMLEDSSFTVTDVDDMQIFLNELSSTIELASDDKYMESNIPALPPVGTRVRRGPEWMDGSVDGNGPGTVIGIRPEGLVHVIWDICTTSYYKYGGDDGVFQVVVVDDVREHGDYIQPGMLMKRGPHWQGGDEDGGPGSVGVVYRAKIYQIVYVRWPTGIAKPYAFFHLGRKEIESCNAEDIKRYKEIRRSQSFSGPGHEAKMEQQTFTMEEILPPQYPPGVSATPVSAPAPKTAAERSTEQPKPSHRREVPQQMQQEAASAGLHQSDTDPSLDMIIPYESSASSASRRPQRETRQHPSPTVSLSDESAHKLSRPNKNRFDLSRPIRPEATPRTPTVKSENNTLTGEDREEPTKTEQLNARNKAIKDDTSCSKIESRTFSHKL